MISRSGILAGGNWIVDKVKLIDVYPQQDSLANIVEESRGNGGGAFNLLVDLAKLGAKFPLAGLGLVGNDSDGRWILDQCMAQGISIKGIKTHPVAPTSYTDVMSVQNTGRRTFFHQRGANAFLSSADFDFKVSNAKIFYLGYLLLLDQLDLPDAELGTVAARILREASLTGLKTSIDVVSEESQRFANIVLPALPFVDYCILNEVEIERTTGISTRTNSGIDLGGVAQAAKQFLKVGVREWVIVHYPEGASAIGKEGLIYQQACLNIPQSKIVGTVGAGDAFAAGVLFGLHENQPIQTCLQYGVCTAASCLLGPDTSSGILPLNEILALMTNYGVKKNN